MPAAADHHVGAGAVGHARAPGGQPGDLVVVGVDAVRHPRPVGPPPAVLEVLDGPAAEGAEAERVLVGVLGQVGVEADVEPLGQLGRAPHEVGRDRERRARRQRDPDHRPRRGVVVAGHRLLAGGEDRVVVLHDRVGREAAVLLRQRHRAPGRVEADPEVAGRGDLGAQQVAASGRVDVEVVGRRRAPAQRQLGQAHPGGDVRGLLVEQRPARVQRGEPVEQRRPGGGPERPGEVLVDVVMGVDQARRDQAAVGPQGPLGGRRRSSSRPPTATTKPSRQATQPPASSRRSSSIVTTRSAPATSRSTGPPAGSVTSRPSRRSRTGCRP